MPYQTGMCAAENSESIVECSALGNHFSDWKGAMTSMFQYSQMNKLYEEGHKKFKPNVPIEACILVESAAQTTT